MPDCTNATGTHKLKPVLCRDEEDEGVDEKLESTKETSQCSKKCLSSMESQDDTDPLQLMQLEDE